MTIGWVFDPASPSGARKGGNAAEYGFQGHIDILVRETVQNSMDAGKPDEKRIDVCFRMIELTGEKMAAFLDAMKWDSLRDNLESINRNGEPIKKSINQMYEKDRILLLCIEDRGTHGLTGSEKRLNDTETNRFSALVRDELYSDKDSSDAGGSFGLGKILLWAYSAYKTVLFSTVPAGHTDGKKGLRFIGRTSLPYHETQKDGPCAGPGWLGIPRNIEGYGKLAGRWAESVWGEEAGAYAKNCYGFRKDDEYGLTTVIVGFEEPGQETREVKEILESIKNAALESFWPALVRDFVSINIRHEFNGEIISDTTVNPQEHPQYQILSSLLLNFDKRELKNVKLLNKPGEATWVDVPIEIPQRENQNEDPHSEFSGSVIVLVKLLDEENEIELIRDRIYRFRRPGMIVRNTGGKGLSISARPYVAAVVCGRAINDSNENTRIEHFLRAAEPPEHDKWMHDTRAVKSNYKTHGIKAKLDRFENNLRIAIRNLVSLPEKTGGALPKELLKHLRFGDTSGGGNPRFITSTINAIINNDQWKFKIRIRRAPDKEENKDLFWHVLVKLKYAVDGGTSENIHAIGEVTCDEATKIKIQNGDAWLEFPNNIKHAEIRGVTNSDSLPAIGVRGVIQINVEGKTGGLEDV